MPAKYSTVFIFKPKAFISYKSSTTKEEGTYSFLHLPIGNYELYTHVWGDIGIVPDATISVIDQTTVTVPAIVIPRGIENILINGGDDYRITTPQILLSWTPVSNAYSYSITIVSNAVGYSNIATTSDTTVIWPVLKSGAYDITIKAFDQQKTLIGIGGNSFNLVEP